MNVLYKFAKTSATDCNFFDKIVECFLFKMPFKNGSISRQHIWDSVVKEGKTDWEKSLWENIDKYGLSNICVPFINVSCEATHC